MRPLHFKGMIPPDISPDWKIGISRTICPADIIHLYTHNKKKVI